MFYCQEMANWVSKYVCMYVRVIVAVEEGQGKDRHRDVYFKLATPRLQSSPNFHLSFCAILTLKLWSSDLLIPPGSGGPSVPSK